MDTNLYPLAFIVALVLFSAAGMMADVLRRRSK
jgi:hypothetical protein